MAECGNKSVKLLFPLSKKVPVEDRTYVPILKTKYTVFKTALSVLITEWLDGKVGTGQPEEEWEAQLIADVNESVNDANGSKMDAEQMDTETKRVYDELVHLKVLGHLRIVTSHRKWLRTCHRFCEKIGMKFCGDMGALMRIHDLSKYTHREVLGYAIMFGEGSKSWRVLEDEDEKLEWQTTLNNHYAANPHHPEYFGLVKPGEQQTNSMVEREKADAELFLEESVIDMLASHGERDLADDPTFAVAKCLDINPRYLGRYEPGDREKVIELLEKWRTVAAEYLSVEENVAAMHGHFDHRAVTYDPLPVES